MDNEPLVLDLVEWVARKPRSQSEAMEIWRTSCPRLTIWEDALDAGLITRCPSPDGVRIDVTEAGRSFLSEHGRSA